MSYRDRIQKDIDEATAAMDQIIQRAETEDRDLTEQENEVVRSHDERRGKLLPELQSLQKQDERTAEIDALRSRRMPDRPRLQQVDEQPEPVDLLRTVPTPGHWASLIHRAWVKRDREAIATLEDIYRAHQVIADNPGVVPQQVAGPVVDALRNIRPLVQSVTTRTPPGPKFDRPVVTQQVGVGQQTTEKTPTTSQPMKIDPVTITLMTQAGHLNISKQDIRWSQPSILGLVYDSFAKVYARVSDKAACTDFVAAVTQTSEFPGAAAGPIDPADVDAALGTAAGLIGGADGDEAELNHLWLSRDVAVNLASVRDPNGGKVYNIPLINGTSGDLDGIPVTIDPRFAAGTVIAGDDALVEFWEDLEGFLSVDEPDVLGQLVGYAGYSRLAVLVPDAFVQFTNATTQAASSGGGAPTARKAR